MKKTILACSTVFIVIIVLSGIFLFNSVTTGQITAVSFQPPAAQPFEDCSIIFVKFKRSQNVNSKNNAERVFENIKLRDASIDAVAVDKIFKAGGSKSILKEKYGLNRWTKICVPKDTDVLEELKKWLSKPEVEIAELMPANIVPAAIPNDPQFDMQWHLNNSGANRDVVPPGREDVDIDAIEAWDIETGDILVAAADYNINWSLVDLVDNIWRNLGEDFDGDGDVLYWDAGQNRYTFDPDDVNGLDDDNNGYADDFIGWDFNQNDNNPDGQNYHGTAVNGILAAMTNNTRRVAGVCWNCTLIALDTKTTEPTFVEYLVDNGAKVISMSWGGPVYSAAMQDALNVAHDAGVVLFASAMNNGDEQKMYPNGYENVVSVTATNQTDELINWSSYGAHTDIGAPGISIRTLHMLGGSFFFAGTSASSPMTAGVAALVMSKNPSLSPDEVVSILQTSVDPFVNFTKFAGNGRLNAHKALQLTQKSLIDGYFPVAILNKSVVINGDLQKIYGKALSSNFQKYRLEYGPGYYPSSWTLIIENTAPTLGLLGTFDTTSLPKGNYTIRLNVSDTLGNYAVDMTYVFVSDLIASLTLDTLTSNSAPNVLSIIGTAGGSRFQNYKIEYGVGQNPASWTQIGPVHTSAVFNGELETFSTAGLQENYYTFRLNVTNLDGGSLAVASSIIVSACQPP